MLTRTDDPIADYNSYCAEQEKKLDKLPRCSECDNPIQDEYAYYINGEWICSRCIDDNYKRQVTTEY